MNEAPKKIWMCFDDERCGEGREYIRADLVDGLVAALEYMLNVCPPIDPSGEDAHEKARSALKALETNDE